MNDIFARVDAAQTLAEIIENASREFSLGTVQSFSPIQTGYQDCNVDVTTSSGRYVVKIFSREKDAVRVGNVVNGYMQLSSPLVPFPALVRSVHDRTIMTIPGNTGTSSLCVFEFVSGKNMTQTQVSESDITFLSRAMATIHSKNYNFGRYYDTLGIINVVGEFKSKQDALMPDEVAMISSAVSAFSRIKLAPLRTSVIHGTFEKENVIKRPDGTLCLLDLGCMDYAASVLDIATFIANFTVYHNEDTRRAVVRQILAGYEEILPIPREERTILPALVRAQYASWIVGMTYHMRKEHNMTKQNQTWLDRGWSGLRAYQKVRTIA